jgi:hypothetical protein
MDPAIHLANAAEWSVEATLVQEGISERGMGQLVIARRQGTGRLACGFLVLDTYCLGVKNAFWRLMGEAEFSDAVKDMERVGPLRSVTPEAFAKMVLGAVEFAQANGFAPHPDFGATRLLLQGIDPALCPEIFVYGKNGRPFYVNGPYDTPDRIKTILQKLEQVGGDYALGGMTEEAFDEIEEDSGGRGEW